MSELRTVSIVVRGKVQGVWFRASAKSVADTLALTGFVANSRDGSVYIEASGTREALSAFERWCHEGPELAEVTGVEVTNQPFQAFTAFDIKRGAF